MSEDDQKSAEHPSGAAARNPGLKPKDMVDHYRIIRPLGAGGMAEVYLARDTMLGRKVALKIVHSKRTEKKDTVQRFLFEAKATARFNHPHIVTIHHVGIAAKGPYLALEYLEGQTLRERLEQERLSVKESIRIAMAIAKALAAAHKEEILHRDLKPDNVMLARDGKLRVLDFGLSQILRDPETIESGSGEDEIFKTSILKDPFISQQEGLKGTPAYMSPEQWKAEKIGPPADIWALGLILYEMLVGRHPYHDVGSMHILASRVASSDTVPRPDSQGYISLDLMDLLTKCLAKNSEERPTASDVVQELNQMLLSGKDETLEGISPFRGLVPFEEEHSVLYFGREVEVTSFVERLRYETTLPVVGPAGAGKSSFVKAGVIPRLRERGPLILIQLRPGRDPFGALTNRLVTAWRQPTSSMAGSLGPMGNIKDLQKSDKDNSIEANEFAKQLYEQPYLLGVWLHRLAERHRCYVILFVDQLEELCALSSEEDMTPLSSEQIGIEPSGGVIGRFMQAITCSSDDPQLPVRVILTLREEFLTRLMTNTRVREELSRIFVLRKPSRKTLVEILELSVKTVGYKFEDVLLSKDLVKDAKGSKSNFSLFQFAGQVMWENRNKQQKVLTRASYEEMGGVTGALVQHADGFIKGLTSEEEEHAKTLFLRLVTEDKTRRIVGNKDLLAGLKAGAESVLEKLVESRLVTISRKKEGEHQTPNGATENPDGAASLEGDCEIIHEALIIQWDLLNHWIDESREEIRLRSQINQAAELWSKRGRQVDELWSARALKETQALVEASDSQNALVKDFIQASRRYIRGRNMKLSAIFGTVIMALLVGAWVGDTIIKSKLCTGANERLTAVWGDETRKRVGKAFLGTGLPYAKETLVRVQNIFDIYLDRWAGEYKSTCEATRITGEQSEEVMDLRMSCLTKRIDEIKALVDVFAKADETIVKKAVQASASLTDITICEDVKALRLPYAPPTDAATREKVKAIEEGISQVTALHKTGKYQRGVALAQKLRLLANQTNYDPVRAQVLLTLGMILDSAGDITSAYSTLHQAVKLAAKVQDGRLVARAMIKMAWVVGYKQNKQLPGLALSRDAELILQLIGGDKLLEIDLLHSQGAIVSMAGDHTQALSYYNRVIEARIKANGPDTPELGFDYNNLSVAYYSQRNYEKAREFQELALRIKIKTLGGKHPSVALSVNNLGLVCFELGQYEAAKQHLERALQLCRDAYGSIHPRVAWPLQGLGATLLQLGDVERAEKCFEDALVICEKKVCQPQPFHGAQFGLAKVLWEKKEHLKRAQLLAQQARDGYKENEKRFNDEIIEIESWLGGKTEH